MRGVAQNIDPADLVAPTLEALADQRDLLVVVATGTAGADELPFPIPSNARVAGFLPYDKLLPRVDGAVTNGGWGGTLAMLAHDIPSSSREATSTNPRSRPASRGAEQPST